jgi:hypothetical protein
MVSPPPVDVSACIHVVQAIQHDVKGLDVVDAKAGLLHIGLQHKRGLGPKHLDIYNVATAQERLLVEARHTAAVRPLRWGIVEADEEASLICFGSY